MVNTSTDSERSHLLTAPSRHNPPGTRSERGTCTPAVTASRCSNMSYKKAGCTESRHHVFARCLAASSSDASPLKRFHPLAEQIAVHVRVRAEVLKITIRKQSLCPGATLSWAEKDLRCWPSTFCIKERRRDRIRKHVCSTRRCRNRISKIMGFLLLLMLLFLTSKVCVHVTEVVGVRI